ncbi:ChaN family lipoprotein [Shinella curvata]|uniref:ChaN family lipoprotein n=1 Tax=Shinella curvata TaxID=1817964 RepID=A0ABT8X9R5_9HYPH|nr:ChaN family lipoprotein [Shinella curvata]MCJ8055125.1 ChaN family lipoprotein [Shinella curvata]MDO6120479.1 ChaN family lipoprotein [Shinella curvata]
MTGILHLPGTWLDPQTATELSHADLLHRLARKRAVLLGETHDRYDIHRWQLHVAASLLATGRPLVMGFEMFPRRVQPALDAWVTGHLETADFLEQSEWATVWGFTPELYLPLFHFCRQFRVPMKALNCRRPLVTEVGKLGWEAIPEAERDGVTPAKPATAAYRQYLFDLTGGGSPARKVTTADSPDFDRFVRAQQTWDRAFACGIADVLNGTPDALVIGIIGRGHLEFGHGTPFQLADLGVAEVAVLLPSDETSFDPDRSAGIADALFRLDTHDKAPGRTAS